VLSWKVIKWILPSPLTQLLLEGRAGEEGECCSGYRGALASNPRIRITRQNGVTKTRLAFLKTHFYLKAKLTNGHFIRKCVNFARLAILNKVSFQSVPHSEHRLL
jgi:hypothetical protein